MGSNKDILYRLFTTAWLIRESINRIIAHFDAIPKLLLLATLASVLLGLLSVGTALIPNAGMTIWSNHYTHKEFWHDGYSYACLIVGMVMILLGIGIYTRKMWSRPLLVLLPIFQLSPFYVAAIWSGENINFNWKFELLGFLIWAVVMTLYLALNKSAKLYYASVASNNTSQRIGPGGPIR